METEEMEKILRVLKDSQELIEGDRLSETVKKTAEELETRELSDEELEYAAAGFGQKKAPARPH